MWGPVSRCCNRGHSGTAWSETQPEQQCLSSQIAMLATCQAQKEDERHHEFTMELFDVPKALAGSSSLTVHVHGQDTMYIMTKSRFNEQSCQEKCYIHPFKSSEAFWCCQRVAASPKTVLRRSHRRSSTVQEGSQHTDSSDIQTTQFKRLTCYLVKLFQHYRLGRGPGDPCSSSTNKSYCCCCSSLFRHT